MPIPKNHRSSEINSEKSVYLITQYSANISEDMQEVIDDLGIFEKQRKMVLEWWSDLRRESRDQFRAKSSKYDLYDFLSYARDFDGLVTMGEISNHFDLPSLNQIADVVGLAVRKQLLKIVAGKDNYSELTAEQIKRFKRPAGVFPQVYKLTEEGLKYLGEK